MSYHYIKCTNHVFHKKKCTNHVLFNLTDGVIKKLFFYELSYSLREIGSVEGSIEYYI